MRTIRTLRKRGLALVMALVMCLSLLPTTAMAAENQTGPVTSVSTSEDSPVQVTKSINKDGDRYTLTMEAYATNDITVTTDTKPMDIVLVLDQSGSMDYCVHCGAQFEHGQRGYDHKFQSRKNALVDAVSGFVNTVNGKATQAANHRIAIVGFGSDDNNTEILTAQYEDWWGTHTGVKYDTSSNSNYQTAKKTAFQDTTSSDGKQMLTAAINAIAANGATRTDLGMTMAKDILDNDPKKDEEGRLKLVIMFTDGSPTSSRSFDETVAGNTISKAHDIKGSGTAVYTIGIFDGANAGDIKQNTSKENKFMHYVSSNYPDAQSWNGDKGNRSDKGSYYKAAGGSTGVNLDEVFDQVLTEASSLAITADATSVLSDTLSSNFAWPDDASKAPKVYRVPVTGKNNDGYIWGTREDITATVNVSKDGKKIDITGYDYTSPENCVTSKTQDGKTTYSGAKLEVVFDIVPDTSYEGWTNDEHFSTNSAASLTYKSKDGEEEKVNTADLTTSPTTSVPTYQVTYTWNGLPSDGTKLYDSDGHEVAPQEPTDARYYITGQTYQSQAAEMTVYTHDEYGNQNGSYTLTWNGPEGTTINGANVSYTGTWGYMGLIVGTANVTFTTSNGGKVVNGTDAEGANTYGDVTDSGLVNRPFPTAPVTEAEAGYHFVGWKVTGAAALVTTWPEKVDQDYIYTAVFEENSKHKVSYNWTGLPAAPYFGSDATTDTTAVTRTHPLDAEVAEGAEYTVDTTVYNPVYTHGTNEDGSIFVNGKYVFGGWNGRGTQTMGNHDVTYMGTWKDVTGNPVTDPEEPGLPKYPVTYKVEIDISNGFYPSDDVKKQLAGINTAIVDSETYFFNQAVTLKTIETQSVADRVGQIEIDGKVENPGVSGTWVFSGWKLDGKVAQSTEKMAEGGLTFTGVWTFTRNPVYTVKYFQQNASGGYDEVLADRVLGTGAAGTEVTAEVKDYEGFELNTEKSKTSGKIIAQDNGLILELYYDPIEPTLFTVTYKIEGDDHGAEIPEKQTYKFGEDVTVADVLVVPGYTFNGWNGTYAFVDGKMPAHDVTLTGSFTAQALYYEVQYLDKETGAEIINSERVIEDANKQPFHVGDAVLVATIAAANKDKCNGYGYMYDSADPAVQLIISADYSKNVIKLYYQKITCKVNFLDITNGEPLCVPVTISGLTPGATYDAKAIETLALAADKIAPIAIKDYTFVEATGAPLTIVHANNNVVNLFYSKQPSCSYTVYYMEAGTTKQIADSVTETRNVKAGDKIDPDHYGKNISGYTFENASPAEWLVKEGENSFILYYSKETSTSYTVNYFYQGEDVPYAAVTEPNAVVGALIPVDAAPAGYKLVEVTGPLHVVEGSDNIVNVYYAKRTDLSYTVKYYKDSLTDQNYLGELSGQGTLGEEIKPDLYVYAPNGYPVPGTATGQMTITANEAENVVKVLYTKDSVTYNYRIMYWQDSVDGTPLGSIPATSAVPVEQVILTNEQLNTKKPSAGGYKDGVQVSVDKDQNLIHVVYTKENPDPDKYTVTYEWTTEPVPQDVYLPIDTNAYAEGEQFTVDGEYNAGDKKVVYAVDDASHLYETGAYVFSGWKLDGEVVAGNQAMGSSNVVLKGAWTWVRANTYSVTYEWANGKAPAEARLPVGETGLYTGQRFTVANEPTPIDRVVNGVTLGTWTFLGWSNYTAGNEYTISRADVTIYGEWVYEPLEHTNTDLSVTKTSEDQNVSVGNTVTWTIEIENTRDDITYSGLSLEEYLTGVYGEEALTGEDLTIFGEYTRSNANSYPEFEEDVSDAVFEAEDEMGTETEDETTTESETEITEEDETVTEDEAATEGETTTEGETATEGETTDESDPAVETENENVPELDLSGIPAAFDPNASVMSHSFTYFSMPSFDDVIDAGMSVETADWRNFTLGPKDKVVFVVEYTVQDGDQDLKNQVTVMRGSEELGGDTADDIHVQEPAPSVTVVKTPVVPENGYVAGNDVQWIITVKNDTKYPVEGLSLTDTIPGVTVEGTLNYLDFDLAPEGKTSFTATLANAPAGTYTNAVVVEKDGKTVGEDTADEVTVSGLFTVTYTDGVGGQAFADQRYDNRVEGTATPAFRGTPAREGYVFTGWSPDVAETVTSNATYTAQWVSAVVPTPSFSVVKTADRTTASVGDTITYTITVTNTGNVLLTNIVVSDPMMPNGSRTIASLPVGSSEPIRYTHTVTAAEAGTTLRNTVTVNGTNPNPGQNDPDEKTDNVDTVIDPVPPVTPPVIPPVTPTPPVTIPDTQTPLDPGTTISDQDVPLAGAVGLNNVDHFAYIIGYDDDTVRPLNNITRAEVATIFFRLMTDDYRSASWSTANSFADVKAGDWYNNAISTCANAGALSGYPDGSFKPNATITRAEFAAIAARFLDKEQYTDDGVGDFSDTANHWAAAEIRLAAKAGWIQGDGNKFRPNDPITRAEVMTIVNRMLDRIPDADHMLASMKKWIDNPEDAWYYEAVQEATNEHAYERDEETGIIETWTEILAPRDWKAIEAEWAANGGASAPKPVDPAQPAEGETVPEAETETEA